MVTVGTYILSNMELTASHKRNNLVSHRAGHSIGNHVDHGPTLQRNLHF